MLVVKRLILLSSLLASSILLLGCPTTVTIKAPKKPITVNLNVKIKHEVEVKVQKQVDELLKQNKKIF